MVHYVTPTQDSVFYLHLLVEEVEIRGCVHNHAERNTLLLSGKVDQFGRPVNFHPIDLNDKYLLSTRDLAVYENLEMIADSKVDSLKIEGRMRSAEYVGIVVNIYRKALNSISNGNWKPSIEDISKLKLAFNRGFTGGYLQNQIINWLWAVKLQETRDFTLERYKTST